MKEINPIEIDVAMRYKLLIGAIVPRPIAVVTTVSPSGVYNMAPFSYFTVASHNPMSLLFCIAGSKAGGGEKDTLRNVKPESELGTGEFIIHVASANYAQEMSKSAAPVPYGESEFDSSGLTPVPAFKVKPPRIKEAKFGFECKTTQIISVGNASLVIGEVLHIFGLESIFDEKMRIKPEILDPIGRMAGSEYCFTRDRFELN